jgi:hypothetical protein
MTITDEQIEAACEECNPAARGAAMSKRRRMTKEWRAAAAAIYGGKKTSSKDVLMRIDMEWCGTGTGMASDHADRILSALDAAGFAVVPKEPTAQMIAYARAAHIERVRRKVSEGTIGQDPDGTLAEQYRVMLRAAEVGAMEREEQP